MEVRVCRSGPGSPEFGPGDVLVMATDGLWDVVTNQVKQTTYFPVFLVSTNQQEVGRELRLAREDDIDRWANLEVSNKNRFPFSDIGPTRVAKRLVELARGERRDGYWEKTDGQLASGDDISAFVIPLA